MGLFVAGSVPCSEHLSPSLTLKGSRTMIFEELCASTPHDPQSPRTDASKFKYGGTFALIVLKSCGHFEVGDKYHNLVWVENKYV